MDNPATFFAVAPRGMAPLLVDELKSLGAEEASQSRSGVSFSGHLETAYRACLWLRTANRVLLPLARFRARTPDELYRGIGRIPWWEHLHPDGSLAVDFNSSRSTINHTRYGALKVKDAVVDQFRQRFGKRPSIDRSRPHLRINVHIVEDEAVASLDLSGQSLHKRGYRSDPGAAPLKENLAAAILMRAGWPEVARAGGGLIDPMTGSGTLPIEAAMMASDSAPALGRDYFGFLNWRGHRPEIWKEILAEARHRRSAGLEKLPPIVGYDADPRAIKNALECLKRAGLEGHVHFEKREFGACVPHPRMKNTPGLVVMNPPYGARMGEIRDLGPLYADIGTRLKKHFYGWRAAVFTGNPVLGKGMGLRAEKIYSLYNGAIECKLLRFRIEQERFVERKHKAFGPGPAVGAPKAPSRAQMFANRLRKNQKRLKRWLEKDQITCFRLYDKDLPEYAVAVDVYGKWVHVQEYRAPDRVDPEKAKSRLGDIMGVLPGTLSVPPENIFLKERRRQKGKAQYEKVGKRGVFHEVDEKGLRFLVNFTDYLDTGLFLDQRITRSMIREMAQGKRFLNLFSYTGTATVCAAAGGARSTTSVDTSRVYLDWARKNMALNGFGSNLHRLERADCLSWMEDARGKYDLILIDPPTFSNSKKHGRSFDIQGAHVKLIRLALRILAKRGTIFFSTNYQRFRIDLEGLGELRVEDISRKTLPPDFQRRPKIHKCWRITRRESPG